MYLIRTFNNKHIKNQGLVKNNLFIKKAMTQTGKSTKMCKC